MCGIVAQTNTQTGGTRGRNGWMCKETAHLNWCHIVGDTNTQLWGFHACKYVSPSRLVAIVLKNKTENKGTPSTRLEVETFFRRQHCLDPGIAASSRWGRSKEAAAAAVTTLTFPGPSFAGNSRGGGNRRRPRLSQTRLEGFPQELRCHKI